MGEYAHDYMRKEIKALHGFDIGDHDDEKGNAARHRNAPKRVKCPQCNCHPKLNGLADHLRDKHGVAKTPKSEQKETDRD